MDENTSNAVNGELRVGERVLVIDPDIYKYLVGTVTRIDKAGAPEHDAADNETDDIFVNFADSGYSNKRLAEIEAHEKRLLGRDRLFDRSRLDEVVMAPDMLLRIEDISREDLRAVLDSEADAEAYALRVLSAKEYAKEPLTENSGLVVGADSAMTTETLYSPLEFYLHDWNEEQENGEYGMYGLYDDQYKIGHDEAWEHMDAIELMLRREVDHLDGVHGMAEYVLDELRAKVWSIFPSIELYQAELYFETTVKLTAPLTADEMARLKDWWSGQLSDGFGEGLEQREVSVGHDTDLYVVPWSSGDEFFIDTEREFAQRLGPTLLAAEDRGETWGKGYLIAASDGDGYIPGALHIERDDSMMVYANDLEAALAAERDGVKLIRDMGADPDVFYVDTPENRAVIAAWQEENDETGFAENLSALRERLDANLDSFRRDMIRGGAEHVFVNAEEVVSAYQAHQFFKDEFPYSPGQVKFLLKFENPLEVVTDKWLPGVSWRDMENAVFGRRDAILNSGDYKLARGAMPEQTTAASHAPQRGEQAREEQSGYTSVLDRINADKAAKRARQVEQDSGHGESTPKPKRKREGEEL